MGGGHGRQGRLAAGISAPGRLLLRGSAIDFSAGDAAGGGGPQHGHRNGEPRMGDPYQTGMVRLPVLLRPGTNDFLFQGSRGRIWAKLVAPRAPAELLAGRTPPCRTWWSASRCTQWEPSLS